MGLPASFNVETGSLSRNCERRMRRGAAYAPRPFSCTPTASYPRPIVADSSDRYVHNILATSGAGGVDVQPGVDALRGEREEREEREREKERVCVWEG